MSTEKFNPEADYIVPGGPGTEIAKHSPGPWHVVELKGRVLAVESDSGLIAVLEPIQDRRSPENANLIAAAPELLKELRRALEDAQARLYMLPNHGEEVSQQKDILSVQIGRYAAAIAEAEGSGQ